MAGGLFLVLVIIWALTSRGYFWPMWPALALAFVLAIQAWTTLVGIVSLEVFGHWRNTILEPEEFFEATIRDLAATVGLS